MIIRKVKLDDANNLLSMLLCLDKETKYMLLEPNERDNDVSRVQGMIQQSINGANLLLVAEEENTIVGFLSAQRGVLNIQRISLLEFVKLIEEKELEQSSFQS